MKKIIKKSKFIGETIRLKLLFWDSNGEVCAELDGMPVFVSGGIPDELVDAKIIREFPKYLVAVVTRVLQPSKFRKIPECKYFGTCTGCQFQHIDYEQQLEIKKTTVENYFYKIIGMKNVVQDVLAADNVYEYRNHARFTVRNGNLGFVNKFNRQFVRIDECAIMNKNVNASLTKLQNLCMGETQISVRACETNSSYLVQPNMKESVSEIESGQPWYYEELFDKQYRVSSPSFFQVNKLQTEKLIMLIESLIDPNGQEIIVDAYCGVGTFVGILAEKVKKIIAIEQSSAALIDAQHNIPLIDNIELIEGRTEDILNNLDVKPDWIILDPPRKGCSPVVLDTLNKFPVPNILYVSCSPENLAKDLNLLIRGAYVLDKVVPVDMFPQTQHIECVAVLRKKETKTPIFLVSSSERRKKLIERNFAERSIILPSLPDNFIGANFDNIEEIVLQIAKQKMQLQLPKIDNGLIISADTLILAEGKIIGKPSTTLEARNILKLLRDKVHEVVTGVIIIDKNYDNERSCVKKTKVTMRNYDDVVIEEYINSGIPFDRAGSYGIQDQKYSLVDSIEGCYTNVLGLPICELYECFLPNEQSKKNSKTDSNCIYCDIARVEM